MNQHTEENNDSFAAVDLGSNSFHMVVARYVDGSLNVIDRIREPVRLANGLDRYRNINGATWERAVTTLEQFGERLKGIPAANIRAVGTNTFRRAKNARTFHQAAEDALRHPIEIISGVEEARLIYTGAIHALPEVAVQRLMIDIGGSSTEIIIGKETNTLTMESFEMGCVTFTQKYFPKSKITRKRFNKAFTAAQLELEQWASHFKRTGWQEAIGTSGTIRTIARVLINNNWSMHGIDRDGMEKLIEFLIKSKKLDTLELDGLSEDRKPVFAGGVAILFAAMKLLKVENMQACDNALREGVLYDLMGAEPHRNVQSRTINVLTAQFNVDSEQAERVQQTANAILQQVKDAWGLDSSIESSLIDWAARVHEVGLSISHGHYHRHGAYILTNADMPGFTQQEQSLLAMLVQSHRRKITLSTFKSVTDNWKNKVLQLCVIFRIAVIVHRARLSDENITVNADPIYENALQLNFPDDFLQDNGLVEADLEKEMKILRKMNFNLSIQ